jgi:type IV pilus assembly protein PilM
VGLGSNQVVTGVDVGASSVKIVRLSHKRGSSDMIGLALTEIPEGAANDAEARHERVVAAIKDAMTYAGIEPGRAGAVVTAVSGPSVSVKHVPFPVMNDKELAESVRWEAKKHLPFDPKNVDLDYQRLTREDVEGEGSSHVLLGAAQAGVLERHVAALTEAGIEPAIVDLAPTVLINEVDEEGLLNGSAVAVADLGASNASLSVYTRGGLFFSRSIPVPKREGKWLEHILTEVRFSLTFYNNETGRKGIESLFLSGGRALEDGIVGRFSDTLGVTTELLDPFTFAGAFDVDAKLKGQSPRFALAMGLARRR